MNTKKQENKIEFFKNKKENIYFFECNKCHTMYVPPVDIQYFLNIPILIREGWWKHYFEEMPLRQSAKAVGLPFSTLVKELGKYGLATRNKKIKRKRNK